MSNKKLKNEGQNRCKRCNRTISDPNADYGWWCAKIVGVTGELSPESTLDETALKMYNAYADKYLTPEKNERNENFTIKENNYTNTFIKEKTGDKDKTQYTILSDINVLGEKFQVEYTIDDGIVRFRFENNKDYWSILWRGGGKKLAQAIYDAGKTLSPDNFSGRTVDGINTELQLHWAAYKAGIKKENAKVADIGGTKEPGVDSNAWFFETIQLTEDIIDPKADDVLDSIKEIWRKLKK